MGPLKEGRAPAPSEVFVPAGAPVFREGDASREVYLVLDGELEATRTQEGREIRLAILSRHAVFGELALLDNQPRSATVTARVDCRLAAIHPTTFHSALRQVPLWFLAVLKVVARRLRDANAKVRLHCVPDPISSFCHFLSILSASRGGASSFPWLALVDEFHLVSRLPRPEIRRLAQVLIDRELARIDSRQEFVVRDVEELLGWAWERDAAAGEAK
jgi:CRP/FNR family transcriptional regulator, cyclic AMP receptor protein